MDTPPTYKRKRASRACQVCKVKKVKCSGTDPCNHCIEYGERCEFESDRNRASSTSHNQELQDRIATLESLVAQHSDQLSRLLKPTASSAGQQPQQPQPPLLAQNSGLSVLDSPRTSANERGDDDAEGDLELGQFNLDSKGNPRYIGPGSTTSIFAQLNKSQRQTLPAHSRGNVSMPWITAQLGVQIAGSLPPLEELAWPDRDLADALVGLYFRKIDPIFPVVHQPEFMRVYKSIHSLPPSSLDSNQLAVIFAVFACASCLSSDPRVYETGGFGAGSSEAEREGRRSGLEWNVRTGTKGTRFFAQVIVLQLHRITDATVDKLVSESLCAFYMCAVNMAVRSWMMLGKAMSMAIDMGCHRTLAHTKLSTLQQERRRKIFWSLYILDRLLASSLGRPFMIQDSDIDADLPMLLDAADLEEYCEGKISTPKAGEEKPTLVAGFIGMVLLYRIAGRATQTVTRHKRDGGGGVEELRGKLGVYQVALQEWLRDDLVEHLKKDLSELSEPFQIQKITARASLHTVQLLINLPLLPRHGQQATQGQVEALANCMLASKNLISISSLVAHTVPPSHYLLDYTQHLSVAGGLLVILLSPGVVTDPAFINQTNAEVERCVQGLREIEEGGFRGGGEGGGMVRGMRRGLNMAVGGGEGDRGAVGRVDVAGSASASGSGSGGNGNGSGNGMGQMGGQGQQNSSFGNNGYQQPQPYLPYNPTHLPAPAPLPYFAPTQARSHSQSHQVHISPSHPPPQQYQPPPHPHQYQDYLPLPPVSQQTIDLIPSFDTDLFFSGIGELAVGMEGGGDWYEAFMNAVDGGTPAGEV